MEKKPKILFTTPVLRHPAVGGPYLRIENTIKALSRLSDLTIYCRTSITQSEIDYYRSFCRNFYCASSPGRTEQMMNRLKKLFNFLAIKVIKQEFFYDKPDYKDFLRLADTLRPDIIWMGYGNISYPLLKYIKQNSNYKVVCDTDSVWSRFILRGLPFAQNETDKKRIEKEGIEKENEEHWGTQQADITTAVSEVDAEYYRRYAKNPEQIQIFSNVIDLNTYTIIPPPPTEYHKPCIYLAGTFWPSSPMELAARWIISDVLPLIKSKKEDVHFYIIGKGSDSVLSDIGDPNITITGQLESVLPYLCHADVAIVPLKFESGTRFKILEAGACNIPVVSTTLGAEGIPVTHGLNILIADDPEKFAREIITLISDPEFSRMIGIRLHSLIEEKYDISTLVLEGKTIINHILERDC